MSAGRFERTRYLANDGEIYPIRVQPETLEFSAGGTTNTPPGGASTRQTYVKVSKGNYAYGIKPRRAGVIFSGAPPTGYKPDQIYYIPILDSGFFATLSIGGGGVYLGVAVDIVSILPEFIK